MTRPVAILCYEKLLPGSQLVSRLEDLGYEVVTLLEATTLVEIAEKKHPLLVVLDLSGNKTDSWNHLKALKSHSPTSHIPVLGFCPAADAAKQAKGVECGAKLVAGEEAVLNHLPQLLDRILEMD